MLKVALTGGIATGKNYVLDRCRIRGIPCLDADDLAHGVMVPGSEATRAIAERFGDVLTADGGVDRRKLGALVFADASARRDLESLVHPAVYRAIEAGLRAFQLIDRPLLAVVAIPLLFETGRAADFDVVVATTCPVAIQRARLVTRGLSEAEIDLRLAAQWSAADKAQRADHVIDTSGSFEETDRQVESLLQNLEVRSEK
jgi:dephospho-CoA kinase